MTSIKRPIRDILPRSVGQDTWDAAGSVVPTPGNVWDTILLVFYAVSDGTDFANYVENDLKDNQ